ncbi:spindle assembly abnormal protein 6 homolog [Episyrphus balteatus]|uniref:spindle assembly abnormal protein 6 homolog n=1 Tax=Episyrphus balteatus TaxID=286459 RepID=UPI0024860A88|nr:spindle assembly abnormal protein 6 homolog [Episyrphus balteatus]
MFSFNFPSNNSEDDYFSNINYMKNIECIIPSCELSLNVRCNGISTKKPFFVYAEKIDFKGLIQLRLAEKADHRKMYISTVDTNSFNELKQDQSLHVSFSGFVENLIKILQDCQRGQLEVDLIQNREHAMTLQFYEMRPFKNLVHLCLPIKPAPLNVILFYMNNVLYSLQKKNASIESSMQCMQHELSSHLSRMSQLEVENAKLRESLLENSKAMTNKHQEEILRMQEALKKSSDHRHSDNERHMMAMSALQAQLDKALQDKANIYSEKCQESKRCEHLRDEVGSLKSALSSVKDQNEKHMAEMAALRNVERKNEMHLLDSRKHIHELQDKIKKFDKVKSDLLAELEAEKKICHTKRQALEMATEEISKANEIIAKQGVEIVKNKKTIAVRTEVALQQEKAIREKDKQLIIQNEKIQGLQRAIESLRKDIPMQLESMKQFADTIENKYSEQISSLNQKLLSASKDRSSGRRTIR